MRNLRINLHPVRALLPESVRALTFFVVPAMTPVPTLGPAIARLTAALTALTTSHAQNTAAMTSLADERVQLEVREKEMRDMIGKTEEKRSWFSAFKEWIESVATFLDEKVRGNTNIRCQEISPMPAYLVPATRKTRRRACFFITGAL